MNAKSKVMWSEGLMLGPQHFQRQDLYHEWRLQRIASSLNPHFWGVRAVQWNLDALGHNRLAADAMSIIFPDGEIVEAPESDPLPEPVDLSRLPADVHTATFHTALAVLKPHGGNADSDGRYLACELETPDLYSEALAVEVPYLKKQLRLVSSLELRGLHTSLPVVQLRRAPQGGFEIDPTFHPPCVAIGAAPGIGRMLDALVSALTAKIEALQRMHRKGSSNVYEVMTGDISSWWMLNMVSTANALLSHCLRSHGLHPEALYRELLATTSGLMTFSDRYKTADLPAYRHDALGDTFGQLDSLLRELVDTVIAAKYFQIPLLADPNRRAFYHGTLDPAKVTRDTQLCLAVGADMPAIELVAAVPIRLKLASPEDLENIVNSALPGLPLTHMPQVPAAIPTRPNTYYFSLSTKGTLYDNALKSGRLAVYAPDGIKELKIELIGFQA